MTSDEGSDLIPDIPCLVPQILIAFVVCKHFLNRFAQLDQIKKMLVCSRYFSTPMVNDKTHFWLSLEPLYYPVFERPPFGKKRPRLSWKAVAFLICERKY